MPFHRFIDPSYFEAVPLPGSINFNAYDRVNVTSGGVGAGGSSPADVAKVGGPTPGTYFVAFGEDGTSYDANRGLRALAQNTDLLDDLLHRDLAVPKVSVDYPNVGVGGTPSFVIADNNVFVGSAGTANNAFTRGGIIGLVDAAGHPLHVFIGGSYQAVKISSITAFAGGFTNTPTIGVTPTIPQGVAFKVVYYVRQSVASQPEDLVVDVRSFDGAWEADIWVFARNILQTNQIFEGDITFNGTVTFAGPASFPGGFIAPVVINPNNNFVNLTINAAGTGKGLVLTSGAGALDVATPLMEVPDDTLSSASGAVPSIFAYGRSNTGAGDAAVGVVGIGGIASGGGLSAPGVVGLSLGGDSTGVLGISNALNGIGVEGRGALYGVRGELLAPGDGNAGVYGFLDQVDGWGVYGQSFNVSTSAGGVKGDSAGGPGVYGSSELSFGVVGVSLASVGGAFSGVSYGASASATGGNSIGLFGLGGPGGVGVSGEGHPAGGYGVKGVGTLSFTGVFGLSQGSGFGMFGQSTSGTGVRGLSATGIGGDFLGGGSSPGVRGIGGATGNLAHGVVGIGGGSVGNLGAGVFGTGGTNGSGLAGQGTGSGSGVFANGGATNGPGGTFFGGGLYGPGVVGYGSLGGVAGGASGGVFLGAGAAPGVVGFGGAGFGGVFSTGGFFQGGTEADGVIGYAGDPDETNWKSGVVGYGKSSVGARGLYGVLGTIAAGTSSDNPGYLPAGVRGAAEELGDLNDILVPFRSTYGGIFTGTGRNTSTSLNNRGGYGLLASGSKSRADIRIVPRTYSAPGSDVYLPNTGRVGDVCFMVGYGLIVCTETDVFTGQGLWKGILLSDPVWTNIDYSPYRDPEQPGSAPVEP